jgi:hypothetical protein
VKISPRNGFIFRKLRDSWRTAHGMMSSALGGVIGTDACVQSVSTVLAARAAGAPLLKALADAARSVFVLQPLVTP